MASKIATPEELMLMAQNLRRMAVRCEEKARGDGLAKPTIELCSALLTIIEANFEEDPVEAVEAELAGKVGVVRASDDPALLAELAKPVSGGIEVSKPKKGKAA